MKTSTKASIFATFILLLSACSSDKTSVDIADNGYTEEQGFAFNDLQGVCEKGPFLKGSEVIMYELDSATFQKTGKTFETEVYDNRGRFTFSGDTVKYPIVLLEASGYYTDDITGEKSKHSATLYALVNLAKTDTVYMNVLTLVEYNRINYLMEADSISYAEARKQASKEISTAFSSEDAPQIIENKSMFGSSDENAYIFATNVIIQTAAKDGDINKVLQKISEDIEEDGSLENIDLQKIFQDQADSMDLEVIRKNFEKLDVDTIPEFEKYLCTFAGDRATEINGCKDVDEDDRNKDSLDTNPGSKDSADVDKDTLDKDVPQKDISSSSGSLTTTEIDCNKYNKASWAYLNPSIKYGCILDNRDGQVYKTVVIGKQTWMAENLNFDPGQGGSKDNPYDWSWCYDDKTENCETYGRLYTRGAAMDSINQGGYGYAHAIDLENNHRGACPAGWHIPTSTEVSTLKTYVTELAEDVDAGVSLKSKKGWDDDANGSDIVGFSALPAGYKTKDGFSSKGNFTVWRYHTSNTTNIYRIDNRLTTDADRGDVSHAYSIRCIKNDTTQTAESYSSIEEKTEVNSSSSSFETESSSNSTASQSTAEVDCSKYEKSNWDYLNPDIEYGCILDSRDGQVYKTVVIGEQTWMAENMNYNPGYGGPEFEPYVWSWCYDNDPKNCETYGRLYTRGAAMDSINQGGYGYAHAIDLENNHRGVCPEGWHIPTSTEVSTLTTYVKELAEDVDAGVSLKSKKGWDDDANGSDIAGFAALPAGFKTKDGFLSKGNFTVWRYHTSNITNIYRIDNRLTTDADRGDASHAYSIRCIKNKN